MAYKISSLLLARVFLISILLAIAGQAVATRDMPSNPKNDDQMKQPEFLLHHDHSVLIPGLGRVYVPPVFKPHHPYTGKKGGHIGKKGGYIGGTIGGTSGQIPGGDDTFVPNPGFEVPIPGQGAGIAGTDPHP
ncbi:hypothetical protein REPUB_Repub04eG0133200 [Reevesia pubescens]